MRPDLMPHQTDGVKFLREQPRAAHWRSKPICSCGLPKTPRRPARLTPRADGTPRESWVCRPCEAKIAQRNRNADPEKYRRSARETKYQREYGMSIEEAEAFRASHGNLCDICKQPPSTTAKRRESRVLHIDHNHATGEIRGVLCGPCNLRLGWVEKHLSSIERYLDRA